jgi:hypothetical protein
MHNTSLARSKLIVRRWLGSWLAVDAEQSRATVFSLTAAV